MFDHAEVSGKTNELKTCDLLNDDLHQGELANLGFKWVGWAKEYGDRASKWERNGENIITWDQGNGWECILGRES